MGTLGPTRDAVLAAVQAVGGDCNSTRDVRRALGIGDGGMVVFLDTCAGLHQFPASVPVEKTRRCNKLVLNAANKVEVYSEEGYLSWVGWGLSGPSPGIALSFHKLHPGVG